VRFDASRSAPGHPEPNGRARPRCRPSLR
jgi:hypothetical protein